MSTRVHRRWIWQVFAVLVIGDCTLLFAQPRYPLNGQQNPYDNPQAQSGRLPNTVPGGSPRSPLQQQPATPPEAMPSRPASPNRTVAAKPMGRLLESAEVIATVGNQQILAGDFNFQIGLLLEQYKGKIPADQLSQQKRVIIQQLLPQSIETKILYSEFLRTIPLDKFDESMEQIQPRIREVFRRQLDQMLADLEDADEEEITKLKRRDSQLYNMARVMQKRELRTVGELDLVLRSFGSSLEKERQLFGERAMGQNALSSDVDFKPEVTFDELRERYRSKIKEYEVLPQAKWEQMSVYFSNYASKQEAYEKLGAMGNSVVRGAPFAAVAKRDSDEFKASEGGFHDWTDQGALASTELDRAIFSLELGKLSERIEDKRGFHIIRVLDRKAGGHVSFVDAQKDLKEEIRREKVQELIQAKLQRLKDLVPVWTAFDAERDKATVPR